MHALALCTRQRLDPYHYISNIYYTETHRQQYLKQLMPIDIAALLDSDVCNSPIYQQAAGRRAKARKRAGQGANTATRYHCSHCGAEGHTRWSQQCRGTDGGLRGWECRQKTCLYNALIKRANFMGIQVINSKTWVSESFAVFLADCTATCKIGFVLFANKNCMHRATQPFWR